jgi:hypothetical protein
MERDTSKTNHITATAQGNEAEVQPTSIDGDDKTPQEPARDTTPEIPSRRHTPSQPDPATAEAIWEHAQDRVGATDRTELANRTPQVSLLLVIPVFLVLYQERIQAHIHQALSKLVPAFATQFEEAYFNLETTALALFYANSRLISQSSVKAPSLYEQLQEYEELKACGLYWLDMLVGLKRITADQVKAIRKGQGSLDLASDLVAISSLLSLNWSAVEAMQALMATEEVRITQDDLEAMAQQGTDLLRLIGGTTSKESQGIDWRDQVIVLFHLLEKDYDLVRTLLVFYHEVEGRPDEAAELPSLRGLYYRSRKEVLHKAATRTRRVDDEKHRDELDGSLDDKDTVSDEGSDDSPLDA